MQGDFSRNTFDPKKHYSGVLEQQGRVHVDADWNEQQAIQQHRVETEAVDVIGKCGAPKHAPGFRLTVPEDQLLIGAGRFYVDGILCQNEADVLYSEQPDLPDPPDLSELLSDTAIGLVYLDVWQRHVTALDDPEIREVALGGADTATRIKTIWQVKGLPIASVDIDNVTCTGELREWDELTTPSTGTLNARTIAPTSDNPCLIPPTAGYQRLENQLYRVEIHQGSDSGEVTFKWSRDNGSIVVGITRISGSEITVTDLGRDPVLGLAIGQWVEVLDDRLELNGQPGQLVQIADLDPATLTLTLSPVPTALSSLPDGVDPLLHPKLRRWDQTGALATNTGIVSTGAWQDIEGGIQIRLDSGTYKTGNFWLIPARTATGQIEWDLDDSNSPIAQLPLGIQHHYCRLAIAQLNDNILMLQDCRVIFPPLTELETGESCCTAVIHPGDDIQAAIDALPETGGCICLKTGTHLITQPIRINKSNVTLEGETLGARVVRNNGVSLLQIAAVRREISNVRVEQIHFEVTGSNPDETSDSVAIVTISEAQQVIVQHCRLSVATDPEGNLPNAPVALAVGVLLQSSIQSRLHANQLNLTLYGIFIEDCAAIEITENTIVAPEFQRGDSTFSLGHVGVSFNSIPTRRSGVDFRLEGNQIENYWIGARVGQRSPGCWILGNRILRRSPDQFPFPLDNPVIQGFLVNNEPYLYGVIVLADYCRIADNYLNLNNSVFGGIRVTGDHTRIESNVLEDSSSERRAQPPVAIFVAPPTSPDGIIANFSVIRANTIAGRLNGIGVLAMEGVEILDNQIEANPTFLTTAIALSNTRNTTVSGNQIRQSAIGVYLLGTESDPGANNRILHNRLIDGTFGILAGQEAALEVADNLIENMRTAGFIGAGLLESTKLTHNRMIYCGYVTTGSQVGSGIAVFSSFTDLCVESCEVLNMGLSPDNQQNNPQGVWAIWAVNVPLCRIGRNVVGYTDLTRLSALNALQEHRVLMLSPIIGQQPTGTATVTDNVFAGIGLTALIQIAGAQVNDNVAIGFEKVIFSNNTSEHLDEQPITGVPNATNVWIGGQHLIIMGNHLKERSKTRSSIFFNYHVKAVYIGNLTTNAPGVAPIINATRFVPQPPNLAAFNAQV